MLLHLYAVAKLLRTLYDQAMQNTARPQRPEAVEFETPNGVKAVIDSSISFEVLREFKARIDAQIAARAAARGLGTSYTPNPKLG